MSDSKEKISKLKRVLKWAMLAGSLMAFTCHWLPHDYRAICKAVAALCTGG